MLDGTKMFVAGLGESYSKVFLFGKFDPNWEAAAVLPRARHSLACGVVSHPATEVVAAGGMLLGDDGGPTDAVDVYSVAQDSWRSATPLPNAVTGAVAIPFRGRFVLIGGRGGSGQDLDSVLDYDAAEWKARSRVLNRPVHAPGAIILSEAMFKLSMKSLNSDLNAPTSTLLKNVLKC